MATIDLAIPRIRDGCYFPSLLEPRRRAERALLAGVSTLLVDDLAGALTDLRPVRFTPLGRP